MEKEKEKLVETLHKKEGLVSLRTYQGDVAEFIHNKDQTIADLAIKNQEEKRKKETLIPDIPKEPEKKQARKSPAFLISVIGISLLVGSGVIVSYLIFSYLKKRPVEIKGPVSNLIIQADRVINLQGEPLEDSLLAIKADTKYREGVTIVETKDLPTDTISKLEFTPPSALIRSLADLDLGFYGENKEPDFFLILKIEDYGIAYRDMLAWEKNLPLNFKAFITASTTDYVFKDLIVKNKDTRALVNKFGKVALIYTFLNQETILITQTENSLSALVNIFATGKTTR